MMTLLLLPQSSIAPPMAVAALLSSTGALATRLKGLSSAVLTVCLVTSACTGEADATDISGNSGNLVNDSGDSATENEAAYAGASEELRSAAATKGNLACDLPELPDSRAGQPANQKSPRYSYNTDAAPPQVYAFYRLASETHGGSTAVSGPPGLADVRVTFEGGLKCRIVAQAQLSGDTHVTVSLES